MVLDITTLVALIALAFAWLALRRLKAMNARVAALEARLDGATDALPEDPAEATPQATDADATPDAPVASPTPTAAWSQGLRPASVPLGAFATWLKANWIYPVAGAALVMAAVYLVQYSIDAGLLSPALRIGLTLALGAALIGGAEALRRRWGETGAPLVAATLAGAGIVALMVAILAAFHLYHMIGQVAALAAMALVALGALALGWVMGPLLAALGVLAGAAAPFLLGKGGTPTDLLYGYFALVAFLGMGIDGLRRWGWIAALAVVAPLAGGVLAQEGGAGAPGLGVLALAVAILATALPGGAVMPRAAGPGPLSRGALPETRVGALAVVLAAAILVLRLPAVHSVMGAGVLALLLPVWTARAPALALLALVAALSLPAAIAYSLIGTPLMLALGLVLSPWLAQAAVALAAFAGVAMLWRSEAASGRARDLWALLAIATPGSTLIAAELFWAPVGVIGAFPWAATAMALAVGYTALALWAGRVDGGQGARLGAAAAAALGAIALALMTLLSAAALTAALAVLMVAGAALDRRMNLPELTVILGLGTLTLSWRMLIDPGLDWLMSPGTAPFDVWLALLATLAGPLAALMVSRDLPANRLRDWERIVAETGLTGLVPAALAVVAVRFLGDEVRIHALMGIQGAVLIAASWVQLRRAVLMPESRAMGVVRRVLAVLAGLAAAVCLVLGATILSPVFGGWFADPVQGLPVLNDLILAYALPALVLWLVLAQVPGRAALVGRGLAALWGALWVANAIRHLWHGGTAMSELHGVYQGELYAYTVALLVAGGSAMALALRLGSTGWRIAGLGAIGLAATKAFLVDASGLEGLMRAGAFLGLGLSLAGLAWLNGWAAQRARS